MAGEKKEEAAESVRASLEASIKQIETGGDTTDLEGDEQEPVARTGEAEGEQLVEEEPEGELPVEEEPEGGEEIEEPEGEQPAVKVGRDQETGKFKKADGGEPAKKQVAGEKPIKPVVETPARAPASLSPAERLEFAKASPVLQRALLRREAEITKTLNDTAEARKGYDSYRQMVGPYEQAIRAEGSTPERAINNLLRMSMAMRHAPIPTRVQLVANMAAQFLPRDQATLDMLDNMLGAAFTGQQTQLSPGATPGGQFMDPRFDAFMSDLTARQREREEIAQKAVVAKYEKFAETHEYFNDVRPYMAALIQAEADRGVVLSDEDAYEKACTLHPEVAPIVQQLKAAEAARRGNPRLQRSKAAGGSVRASPAGRMPAKEEGDQPDSVRGSIEKSIRQLEGRAKQ